MNAEYVVSPMLAATPGLLHGFFTRNGGVSTGGFSSLNCSLSGKDDPTLVRENRGRAMTALGLPADALFGVHQVHGTAVAVLDEPWTVESRPTADAMVTRRPGLALGIITADCTPVLFADGGAEVIGAAHAGWRGAVAGILEETVNAMCAIGARRARIVASIGPCIRQPSYEVAADLRDTVLLRDPRDARFFADGARPDRWQFDLAGYCAARLHAAGVAYEVLPHDTLSNDQEFFSHRRNTLAKGGPIGHQLSAIAMTG